MTEISGGQYHLTLTKWKPKPPQQLNTTELLKLFDSIILGESHRPKLFQFK